LTIEELEKLFDYLSNILMMKGFDKNDNLNRLADDIEYLIDKFYVFYNLRELWNV